MMDKESEIMFEIDYEKCTGCSACSSICPRNSIKLVADETGFKYPKIDLKSCISCGLCIKTCPISNIKFQRETHNIYAYQNIDEVRDLSTSGGFFTLISDYIIERGGSVYGASFDKNFIVKHLRTVDNKGRNELRGSKYVQSNIDGVFAQVKKDLDNGLLVLFTGTPCQVSGLNNYLLSSSVNDDNLLTCDFVCHGTSSPLVWSEYITFIEKKYKDKIVKVNFRDKTLGWHRPSLLIEMGEHIQTLTEQGDPFYQLFYSNCILRTVCHFCDYSKTKRVSDISMGDCWGIEKSKPENDDNRGLSLIMVNSPKGINIFEKIREGQNMIEISYEHLKQPHLYGPALMSKKRKKFWEEFHSREFIYILNKYGNYSLKSKMINKIKRIIIKVLK